MAKYITVMDYSTSTITKLVWDVKSVTTEETEMFARNKGNTFTYLKQQLETMYPELPKAYGTTSED